MIRFFSRFILYAIAGLIVLILAGILILQTEAFRSRAKGFLETAVSQSLGLQVKIDRISGDLLFSAALEGVTVDGKDGPLFQAHAVSVSYLPPLLLKKTLFINELQIKQATVQLVRGTDGAWNFEAIGKPGQPKHQKTGPPTDFQILLRRVALVDTDVAVIENTAAKTIRRHFKNIRFAAGLTLKPGTTLSATLYEAGFTLDTPLVALKTLSGEITYDFATQKAALHRVRIGTAESNLMLEAFADLGKPDPVFDLKAAIRRLSLPEVSRLLPMEGFEKGILTGTVSAQGSIRRLSHSLDLRMDRAVLRTQGHIGFMEPNGLDLKVTGTVRDFDPGRFSGRKDLSGNINLDLSVQGTLPGADPDPKTLAAEVSVRMHPSSLGGIPVTGGTLDAVWRNAQLTLKQLNLTSAAGDIRVSGGAAPFEKRCRLDIDLMLPDLPQTASTAAPFWPEIRKIKHLKGSLALSGIVSGWWDTPLFEGTLNGSGIRFNEISADSLKLAVNGKEAEGKFSAGTRLDIRRLAVNEIRFRHVGLTGTLSPDRIHMDIKGIHADGENIHLKGDVGNWMGPTREVTISTLDLSAPDGARMRKIAGRITNQGPIRISLSPSTIAIASLTVLSDQARVSVSGRLHPAADSTANLSIDNLNLTRLSWLLPEKEKISGRLSADITVTGTGKAPKVKADVRIQNGSGFHTDFSGLTLGLTYGNGKAAVTARLDASKNQTVAVNGKADLKWSLLPFSMELPGSGVSVTMESENLDLAALPTPQIPHLKYRGLGALSASLSGDLKAPVIRASLSVTKGLVSGRGARIPFEKLTVDLDYQNTQAVVQAAVLRGGKQILNANSRTAVRFSLWPFSLRPLDQAVAATLKIEDVPLDQLPLPEFSGFDYSGKLNFSAAATGSLARPVLTADLSIRKGRFFLKDRSGTELPFSELIARLDYGGSKAAIEMSLRKDSTQLLGVTGDSQMDVSFLPFQFKPPGNMNLDLAARGLNISMLLLPKTAGLDLNGTIDLAAKLRGALASPEITGTLSFKDGSLSLKKQSLTYETVSSRIRLLPGKLVIEELLVSGDTEGSLRCAGEVGLSGFRPADFDIGLAGKNVFIPFHPAIKARIDPDIRLAGSPGAPRLTGTVSINESRINLDRLARQGPAEIQVVGDTSADKGTIDLSDKAARGPSVMDPLKADLAVKIPKNGWLNGQGLTAEIGGQIHLQKDPGKPFTLLGDLNTLRGTYSFQGKLFKFKKGTVSFLGLEEPNPNLDISAAARVNRVSIILEITGTARDIRIALSSDPVMEQTDIISYLLFGQSAGSLNDRESAAVETAAMAVAGQMAASELKNIFGGDLFLDMIAVDSGGGDLDKSSVTVGKYVTPDVFVTYRQGVGSDAPYELEATYEVNKNISVQTQVGNEKTTGVDILWRMDF